MGVVSGHNGRQLLREGVHVRHKTATATEILVQRKVGLSIEVQPCTPALLPQLSQCCAATAELSLGSLTLPKGLSPLIVCSRVPSLTSACIRWYIVLQNHKT